MGIMFHGYVSWLHVVKKFHGQVAYDGSIWNLCTIAHICNLELEYAQATRSKIIDPARNKGNGEMLGVNGHVRDGNVFM